MTLRNTHTSQKHNRERSMASIAPHSIQLIRFALAIIFIWFGLLKLIDRSPIASLLTQDVFWIPPEIFVQILGASEIIVGFGLLSGAALTPTLHIFWLNVAGTFLALIAQPDISISDMISETTSLQTGNAAVLGATGEIVIKGIMLTISGFLGNRRGQQDTGAPPLCSKAKRRKRSARTRNEQSVPMENPSSSLWMHNILCRGNRMSRINQRSQDPLNTFHG